LLRKAAGELAGGQPRRAPSPEVAQVVTPAEPVPSAR
jgi:hypothetical protein